MIRKFTEVDFVSQVLGGETLSLSLNDRPYEFRFPQPLNVSLEVALVPLEERINDDDRRNKSGIRCAAAPWGLRIWDRDPDRTAPIKISLVSKSLRFDIKERTVT